MQDTTSPVVLQNPKTIIPFSYNLADLSTEASERPWRIGLVGASGSGKTYAALSFPNPVVMDYDNKLSLHRGKDIPTIPFWDEELVKKMPGGLRKKDASKASVRDATIHFLENTALKLEPNQTLVFDSWTYFQQAMDEQLIAEMERTQSGELDTRARWGYKAQYSKKILKLLKNLKCNVIVTFHEAIDRDEKTGEPTGKLRPVMEGSVKDQLASAFSDYFRQVRFPKMGKEPEDRYMWQISCSRAFDPILSRRWKVPGGIVKTIFDVDFIPAGFESLTKD